MNQSIEYFKQLGLTEEEAKLYMILIQKGVLTGFSASKLSGVSKADSYASLNILVKKGFAYRIEGEKVSFKGRPFLEIRKQIEREMEKKLNFLSFNLRYVKREGQEFINIEGNNNIIEKAMSMINSAEHCVYLDVWSEDVVKLLPLLKTAKSKGINCVLFLQGEVSSQAIKSVNYVLDYSLDSAKLKQLQRSFSLVIDNRVAFSGQIGHQFSQAVFSANSSFISLVKGTFEHDIFNQLLKEELSDNLLLVIKKVKYKVRTILKE